jgi:putative transposase
VTEHLYIDSSHHCYLLTQRVTEHLYIDSSDRWCLLTQRVTEHLYIHTLLKSVTTSHLFFFTYLPLMRFQADNLYHIYNRGNGQQTIFLGDRDYLSFLEYIRRFIAPYCDVLAWCLMPNHFHLLLNTTKESTIEKKSGGLILQQITYGIKQCLSSYTKSFNVRNGRTGNLFQQKTKAKNLIEGSSNYAETAFFYIHQNPWVAGLVDKLEDWPYSSYLDHIDKRNGTLINKAMASQLLNFNAAYFTNEVYTRVSPEKERLLIGSTGVCSPKG